MFSVAVKNAVDGLSGWGESVSIDPGDKIGTVRGEPSTSDILGGEMWTARGGCSSKRGWRKPSFSISLTIGHIVCQKCALVDLLSIVAQSHHLLSRPVHGV